MKSAPYATVVEGRGQLGVSRVAWIDTARGLGIFFVVIGHAVGLPDWTLQWLFAFHIPFFFWLAGFFAPPSQPWLEFLRDRVSRRLLPYMTFALGSYVLWLLALRHFGTRASLDVSPWTPLLGIVYGSPWNHFLEPNLALWFFPCLFMTEVYGAVILRLPIAGQWAAVAACALVGPWLAGMWEIDLPWGSDVAVTAVAFYCAGALLRARLLKPLTRKSLVHLLVAGGLGSLFISLCNAPVAMVVGEYGRWWLFYPGAVLGIAGLVGGAAILAPCWLGQILGTWGRHSLVIFAAHLPLFAVFTGACRFVLRLPATFREDAWWWAVLYALCACLVLTPVSRYIHRRLSWLAGASRSGR